MTKPKHYWDTFYGVDNEDGEPCQLPCLRFSWGCVICFDYNRYEEQLAMAFDEYDEYDAY